MARLKAASRARISAGDFALPGSREFPIEDKDHAEKALQLMTHRSASEQAKIRAAVHRKYPDVK